MSENNYGNNQGNAQNPYAAQQPNSSAQGSYGQCSEPKEPGHNPDRTSPGRKN